MTLVAGSPVHSRDDLEASVSLLGLPLLLAGGQQQALGPERGHQLVVYAAAHPGEWLNRDHLAALFWPEHPPSNARRNLRKVLFRARALVPQLEVDGHAVRLRLATDVQAFETHLRAGQLGSALSLWRGPPLAGLDEDGLAPWTDWLALQRQRWTAALRQAAHAELQRGGEPLALLRLAETLLALDPFDEAALGACVDAELALGRPARARSAYQAYTQRLAAELGAEPAEPLRRRLALVDSAGAAPTAPAPHAFVGRRAELRALQAALAAPAGVVVQVLGLGGMGKSRLVHEALGTDPRSLWLDAQALAAGPALRAALASRLALSAPESADAALRIGRQLAGRIAVIDNAEQLDSDGRQLLQTLGAMAGVRLVLTSRVRLDLGPSHQLVLHGLPVPDEESTDLAAARHFDAVRLFENRARLAEPGFAIEHDLAAVLALVSLLDGLPLGIELAAAWVRLVPPATLAAGLRRSIKLLQADPARPRAQARPEHRSLHAMLDQSLALLGPDERLALTRLSVFSAAFDADAAQAVCAVGLPVLSTLVDRSLVARVRPDRFQLHPLVQAHAWQALAAPEVAGPELLARHAAHMVQRVADAQAGEAADPAAVADGLEALLPELRSAWATVLARRQADGVTTLARGFELLFDRRGRPAEGLALLAPALALAGRDRPARRARMAAQRACAVLHYRRHELAGARTLAGSALKAAQALDERRDEVRCLALVGACLSSGRQWADARQNFERALALSVEDGQRHEIAATLTDLGVVAKREGRWDDAMARYEQALALHRELPMDDRAARCINNFAVLHMELGQWQRARALMAEGLALCRRRGLKGLRPYLEVGLGLSLLELGELVPARAVLAEAGEAAAAAEVTVIALMVPYLLARVDTLEGRLGPALAGLQQAARQAAERGLPAAGAEIALYFGEWLAHAGEPAAAARAWQAVQDDPAVEAGVRASAGRWQQALPAGAADAAAAPAAATIDEVLALLRGWPAPPDPAPGNGGETPA